MSSRKKRATQEPKRHILPFVLILIVTVIIGSVSLSVAGAHALVKSWLVDLPSVDGTETFNNARKTRIYASDGQTLLAEFYAQNREPVTADQVSPNLFNATVAIEDERFWEHGGVDPYGIARAAFVDLTGGDLQGASTITQQLVRQTILQDEANETTIKRKVREAALAMEMEKQYSKEEVLMMYINTINYGDGAWGIQAAALHYYSKNASELTIPEAALLAGIPQNPTYNNPVYYPDKAFDRRNMVLGRMYANGMIDEAQYNEFVATELNLVLQEKKEDGIYAQPYFTSYVREYLLNQYAEDKVFKDGMIVYTTIDLGMQAAAEEVCLAKEEQIFNNTGDDQVEVGLTAVEPSTGYIKAMRGGKDYYTDQFNTAWQMRRQAGSCFKVFALVGAIEEGYSPQTMVSGSSPVTIDNNGTPWPVANYGGANMGTMSMASATYLSSNTAYARITRKIGAAKIVDVAQRMGVTSPLLPEMAIVLGAQGVNTLEMASAFGTLAVGGIHNKPTPITKIVDYNGNVIYDHATDSAGEQVLTPEVAAAATTVLRGVVTSGTAGQANLGWQVSAGKTGTSDNFWDSFYVGYTPQLSCAVWIGDRAEQRPIPDNSGGANCCPVWKSFMNKALDGQEAQNFATDIASPPYDTKATFMTPEEIAAEKKKKEEEEKKKKEEEEKKKAEEEEAARKAEEEAAKNEGNQGTDPGTGGTDPGTGGANPGTGGTNPGTGGTNPGTGSGGGSGG